MSREWSIAVVSLGVVLSVACATANRHAPDDATATSPQNPGGDSEAARRPWRPVHKGGADLSTGLYIREDDDLVVNTPMPIVLRRTYNSGDQHVRRFGIDTTHPGEWWLFGDGDPRVSWADLVLADGARIHFVRTSPGDSQEGAVLRHDSGPAEYAGAVLSWTGSAWQMRFPDASLALFRDCQGATDVCSLIERRDTAGHRIVYERDRAGTLLRMESEGQSIAFDYDQQRRIVRAYATTGDQVRYTYDERSRLVRVAGSDAIVRTYEYDDRNNLTAVREPGRILRNWFDEAGRFVRQVMKGSEDDDDPYVATVQYVINGGSIVETHFDEGDGLVVARYNEQHDIVSETLYADGPAPVVFAYNLDPVTNMSAGATMACLGPTGPLVKRVALRSDNDDMKAALIWEYCQRTR